MAVYRHFADTGRRPSPEEIAKRAGSDRADVLETYARLRAQRVLALEADGANIRMAPPFSGVPTQHVAEVDGKRYFANCAWDALGVVAALQRPGVVHSRCEQSGVLLHLEVGHERTCALRLAVPLSRARVEVVGGHRLHVKQHAVLPVGRTRSGVVC